MTWAGLPMSTDWKNTSYDSPRHPQPANFLEGIIDGFWAGLPMSTNWKNTSHDTGEIAYVYQLKRHELRFDPRRR